MPVATLDPAKFRVGGLEYNYANCVFNRLTMQDAKLAVRPDLATSWESTPDLKVWTFHLRPNVTFHDGKTFTSADVLFTYGRLQDKAVASVLRAPMEVITKVEGTNDTHSPTIATTTQYTLDHLGRVWAAAFCRTKRLSAAPRKTASR